MSGVGEQQITSFELPNDCAIVIDQLLIVSYLKPDGSNAYMIATRGQGMITSFLGLTVVAQDHLLDMNDKNQPPSNGSRDAGGTGAPDGG